MKLVAQTSDGVANGRPERATSDKAAGGNLIFGNVVFQPILASLDRQNRIVDIQVEMVAPPGISAEDGKGNVLVRNPIQE